MTTTAGGGPTGIFRTKPIARSEDGPLERSIGLWQLTAIGVLLAFVVVSAAVIVLRYRSPELERTFRVPLMPVTPLLGIGFSLWLVSQLPLETWLRFAGWFVLGVLVYAFYGYRNSRLGRGEAIEGDPGADLG